MDLFRKSPSRLRRHHRRHCRHHRHQRRHHRHHRHHLSVWLVGFLFTRLVLLS